MRVFAVALLLAALAAAPAAAAARPVRGPALLAIDGRAGFRNYLPTRMLPGFEYAGWSYRGGVLRVDFESKSGRTVVWTVAPMKGACDAGKLASYQLAGNKLWWGQDASSQFAWRCVFGLDGKPLRLRASSTTPPTKLAGAGLGIVVASATRY
jgi:opacity protein-like surface antigen